MQIQKGHIYLTEKRQGKTFFRNEKTEREFWVADNLPMEQGKRYSAEYVVYQRTNEVRMKKLGVAN